MALITQTFMIPTDEGVLEAKRWLPETVRDQNALPWALLCHPHPLYGGSMDDGVLAFAREAFVMRGFGVCGFNLPGVGQSTGRSVGDLSETACLEAVCRYFSLEGLTLEWAAGYSYGGALLTSGLGLLPSDQSASDRTSDGVAERCAAKFKSNSPSQGRGGWLG